MRARAVRRPAHTALADPPAPRPPSRSHEDTPDGSIAPAATRPATRPARPDTPAHPSTPTAPGPASDPTTHARIGPGPARASPPQSQAESTRQRELTERLNGQSGLAQAALLARSLFATP